jgi:hypothetical protein
MKKASHFQRVIRQCKFLLKRIKQTNDSLNLSRLKLKLERLIAKYQTNTYLKRLIFGLVISAIPLNEMNGQVIDFTFGNKKGIPTSSGSIPRLKSIDIDNDGDLDFVYTSRCSYTECDGLHQITNIYNNNFPIFKGEEVDDEFNPNTFVATSNIEKLVYKKNPNTEFFDYIGFNFINLDLNEDSLKSLMTRDNYIKVFKQRIINDSVKFDTIPFFEVKIEDTELFDKTFLKVIDINGDENIDFVNMEEYNNSPELNKLKFFINQGNNSMPEFDFLNPIEIPIPNIWVFYNNIFLDYDKDGDYDFGFQGKESFDYYNNDYFIFKENESIGNSIVFSKNDTIAKSLDYSYGGYIYEMLDLDGDSDLDLISTYSSSCPSPGCYSNYTSWIENETINSGFTVKGRTKNIDGEAIHTPIIIEPDNSIKWPTYGLDFINYQVTSEFNFGLDIGTHKIYPRMPEDGWTSSPEYIEITAIADKDSITYQDFILNCTPGKEDFQIVASTFNVPRPGFKHIQKSNILNHSDKEKELIVAWKPDERLEILSIDDKKDSIVNRVYYFTVYLNALGNGILNNEVKVPVNVSIGDTLKSYYHLMPNDDANPENNSFELVDVVVGSWDPNDKIVSPKGTGDEGITDIENKEFTYTIRFQNTGNYYAANVILIDTIDEKFDMKTFQTLNICKGLNFYTNSANLIENRNTEINGNVVKYVLQGINLPPQSENELESQGYVQYSVKLKEGIQPGEIIKNKADIYFDFNNPITTNETINELAIISKVTQQGLPKISSKIYPNPTKNMALLEWDKTISEEMVLSMYDINGKLIISKNVNGGFASINVQNWTNGVYIYVLESQKGNAWGKLIVE